MACRGLLLNHSPVHGIAKLKAVCSPVGAPALTISPHRAGTLSRVRTVCWFAPDNHARYILPDDRVQELGGTFSVGQYDTELVEQLGKVDKISTNKQKLKAAFEKHQNTASVGDAEKWAAHKKLMLAMAMQESNHMDVHQRDYKKDNDGKAANCSIFNLSIDFVEMTGYYAGGPGRRQDLTKDQWNRLNSDDGLPEAVGILECAFEQWGIENALAFVRQGRSGFDPTRPTHLDLKDNNRWREQCTYFPADGVAGRDVLNLKSNALAFNICEYLGCIKRSIRYIDENPAIWDNADRPDIFCQPI